MRSGWVRRFVLRLTSDRTIDQEAPILRGILRRVRRLPGVEEAE